MPREIDTRSRKFTPTDELRREKPNAESQRRQQPSEISPRTILLQRSFCPLERHTTHKDQSRAYEEHARHRNRLMLLFGNHDVRRRKSSKHHDDGGQHHPHCQAVTYRRKLPLFSVSATVKSIPAWLLTVRPRKPATGTEPPV